MGYRELMLRKLLQEMFDKLSEEEKRSLARLTDHKEIMQALHSISTQVERNKHSFSSDLLANISGNAVFDAVVWLASKVFRKF